MVEKRAILDDWYTPMLREATEIAASGLEPPEAQYSTWAGDKYPGGFGATQLFEMDYWTLRERSSQLFRENLYARGLIRRLVTNEINTGLELEAQPEESVIGVPEDSLSDWSELNESRFSVWARNPQMCDFEGRRTFGALQREIRREALISGDVLVVQHISKTTGLPLIQIINGAHVGNPAEEIKLRSGYTLEYGVERDANKRHVAYHANKEDGTSVRLPVKGPRSGRRVAWLVYGSDKRHDDVRGEPLLALILQSVKEIDRYRDAAVRKATINSILAMFIKKTVDKPGTRPWVGGGATRKGTAAVAGVESDRTFAISEHVPGTTIDELQVGEEPVPHSTAGTDVNFGPFEEAIIQAIAWANQIPPEILKLAFSNNYSASQAAINEFKIYLNMVRTDFGQVVCQPIYTEWLISSVLAKTVQATGFLEAWRTPSQIEKFGAWIMTDWSGAIKPSTDIVKQAKGYSMLVAEGWITNDRAARETTGTKFSKNIKRIKRENAMKVDAFKVFTELEEQVGPERAQALLHGALASENLEPFMVGDGDVS